MKILAIDLGKKKSVFCDYDSENGEHEFGKIDTQMEDLKTLVEQHQPERVVFEISSQAGWVYDLMMPQGVEIQVANPNHEAWKWRNVKRKNDRVDALKLAQLSAVNQLPMVYMPKPESASKTVINPFPSNLS